MNELGDDSLYFYKNTVNSEKYFQLFDKYIPVLDRSNHNDILVFSISNPVTIMRMMEKNPEANYVIIDEVESFKTIDMLVADKSFKYQYINIDQFNWNDFDMKFDCIIMIPPFTANIHLKVLNQALKHLKTEHSVIVNVSPVKWLQDPLSKYKTNHDFYRYANVFKKIKSLDIMPCTDATKFFGKQQNTAINVDLGIYQFTNDNNKLIDHRLIKNGVDFTDIFNKIDFSPKKLNDEKYLERKYKNYVLLKVIDSVGQYCGIPTTNCVRDKYGYFINDLSDGKTVAEKKALNKHSIYGNINIWPVRSFKTEQETINFFKASTTLFFRFCCYIITFNINIPLRYLPWADNYVNPRTGLKGYESEWTNEDFYQYFNITLEEQKLIEDTIKQYM